MATKVIVILFSTIFLIGCATEDETGSGQEVAMNLSQSVESKQCIGYFCFETKLLDPWFQAKKEYVLDSTLSMDSLFDIYKNSFTVVVDISVNPMTELESNINVMNIGVNGSNDYEKRVIYMTSAVKNDFYLEVDGQHLSPKISTFENYTGFSDNCKLVLVFVPEKELSNIDNIEVLLSYDDQVFGTGKTKYKLIRELNNPTSI